MNKPELYKKTIDILFESYFNNTLMHGNCNACAVGNIAAASTGRKVSQNALWDRGSSNWDIVFYTCNGIQNVWECNYTGQAKKEIDATGYTWQELARIEFAFETAEVGESDDERMFNGLVAVIEVLNNIHEVDVDTETPRFTAHYNTLCAAQ